MAGLQRLGPVVRHRHAPSVLVAVGATMTVVATMLRWPSFGQTRQNGFRLAESLANLGSTLDLPTVRVVASLWYLIPISAGVALVAVGADHTVAWCTAIAGQVISALTAVAVLWASERAGLPQVGPGPTVALCGAGIAGVGAVAGQAGRQRARRALRSGAAPEPVVIGPRS